MMTDESTDDSGQFSKTPSGESRGGFERKPTANTRPFPGETAPGETAAEKAPTETEGHDALDSEALPAEPDVGTEKIDLEEVASVFDDEADNPCLIVISGARAGEMTRLDDEGIVLGRDRERVDFCFRDPGVSRRHAAIAADPNQGIVLRDLDSSNGTFVNGDRVRKPRILAEGDKITLGKTTTLKFTVQDEIDEEFQRRMYHSSMRDQLTRTYSRAYLLEQMRTEMSFADRNDTNVSLIMFDLDDFKEINDEHGHVVGDRVLERLADLVRTQVREEDLLARYGGEEFAILVRQVVLDRVVDIAERIRETVAAETFEIEDHEINVTLSAGVAEFAPESMPRPTEWIRAADEAMYRAKAAGRNCVKTQDPPSEPTDASETLQ